MIIYSSFIEKTKRIMLRIKNYNFVENGLNSKILPVPSCLTGSGTFGRDKPRKFILTAFLLNSQRVLFMPDIVIEIILWILYF